MVGAWSMVNFDASDGMRRIEISRVPLMLSDADDGTSEKLQQNPGSDGIFLTTPRHGFFISRWPGGPGD